MVNQSKPILAIFGGSFDPPHEGHQAIVKLASKYLDIDKLIVVPAFLNPFKKTSSALASQRLEWCQTLFDNIPKVQVDDYEIQEGKSTTTSQTLKHFNSRNHVKYLIIGADNLSTLEKWHQFEWLNTHITWVIITRENYPIISDSLKSWKVLSIHKAMSSTAIRDKQDLQHVDNKIKHSVQKVLQGKHIMKIEQSIENIVQILDQNKADDIEVFNLEDADYIAKRVIISNSLNGKHTIALAEHIKKALKETDEDILYSDISDDWAVLDLGDTLIHIMIPEYRQRYSIETFLSELVEKQKKNADIDPA
ncbi:Iojap protein [hydrothermal vent metagenome]|uniref:Iojap protein n=1 Tax=hydrothermal vent metagenome TaxID=652676 RepID=A0A1W1D037_9ZZZZ